MVMRINGLGQGPLADRHQLGERQSRQREQPEGHARPATDRVEHQHRGSEQLRAEFAALNRAVQEAEDARAMVTLAGQGLAGAAEALGALQERLCALAEGATPPGAPPSPDGLQEALAALERIAETTRFGPLRLLDGSLGCSGVAVGDGLAFVGAAARARSSPPQGYEVLLSEEPVRATLLAERSLSAAQIAAGVRLLLREGGRRAGIATRAGQRPQEVAAALHAEAQRAGLALNVDATADGRLLVQHQLCGASYRFAAASSLPGVLSGPEGEPRIVANGRDIAGFINGEPADGEGQTLTGRAGNPTTAGLSVRYTGLPFTGATQRLPRSRPAILEPRVFAGRVVVAQQALTVRFGPEPGDTVSLRLDSVRPRHLARGVPTVSGQASLADLRAGNPAEARDALRLVERARQDVARQQEALHGQVRARLEGVLARLRVQAQNFAAASQDLLAPGAAVQAVQALSRHILREAHSALSAQAHPPQGFLLGLLDEEPKGPRWN
jgi:hypothetical protein